MPFRSLSPLANRICAAVSVFTFAAWTLVAATLLAWEPARAALGQQVASVAARYLPGAVRSTTSIVAPDPDFALAESVDDSYGYDDDGDSDGFSWSLKGDGDEILFGGPRMHRMHSRSGLSNEPQLWFRQNGETYVVRDPALVKEARRAAEPLVRVGREMGEVGGEMGRHGAAMGRIGGRMGALSARIARIEMRLSTSSSAHSSAAVREEASELRAELGRLQERLSDQQAEHASRQRELSRRMGELSAKHQGVLREVREQIREIARRALREGKAERPHANA